MPKLHFTVIVLNTHKEASELRFGVLHAR